MKVSINNNWVTVPSSISEITLKQKIDFQATHGLELDAMLKSILEMPEGIDRELETTQFQFEQMFRTFAFFTNCSVEALKESEFIDKIAAIYFANLAGLNQQEAEMEAVTEFTWQNEVWVIDHPILKNGDRMTFGEFIDAKQIIQDMAGLGKNRWECLLPLCAIFLRKKDEPYEQSFLYEGSDRLKLMENLPLDIAMQVGFFLKASLNMYTQAFQSSGLQELKAEVNT